MPIIARKYDSMAFRSLIKEYSETPISRQIILEILRDYQSPNDKISELLKSEDLISLRRGLYVVGYKMDLPQPEPFLIANHLRGPSYISLESALSHWNLIPERVYEISSVTTKTSKLYKTPVGRFRFQRLTTPYYSCGIQNIAYSSKQTILIATPEKALCDKIVLTSKINLRSIKQTKEFLIEDLRIDIHALKTLQPERILEWLEDAPKQKSLKMLLKTLATL